MDGQRLIRDLARSVAPNTAVITIDEDPAGYRVRVTGTSGVVASCELRRAEVDAAGHDAAARERVAQLLKRCADDVDARIPDARG